MQCNGRRDEKGITQIKAEVPEHMPMLTGFGVKKKK
jgi:hypothetical protein